jgi:riboflavin biosynthesis pyrimidine reductase
VSDQPLQRLLPGPAAETRPRDAYRDAFAADPADRPVVVVNMVASLDGRIAVDGRSDPLSSPADKAVFRLLRSMADVVLVGAGTARTERYGTVKVDDSAQAHRAQAGQEPVAALAIVSRSLELDWDSSIFTAPTRTPFVLAPDDAPPDLLARAEQVAAVIRSGIGEVDLAGALRVLRREHAVRRVLCEGGPTLNTRLMSAGLVDELCLTLRAAVVGGAATQVLAEGPPIAPARAELAGVLTSGDDLFLRYRLDGGAR